MELSLETWQNLGTQRRLLDHELFVVDSGPGHESVLFLIHGFPTASWDWAPAWSALTAGHRVIALDLLGYGFSDKPSPYRYTIAEQADLCETLIQELDLGAFHVIAHDYGDTVAQELLARQNAGQGVGRWQSLFLLNGGLFPETHRPRPIQRLLLTPLGPLITRLSSQRVFEANLRAVFGPDTPPTAGQLDGYWRLLNAGECRSPLHALIRYMPERTAHRERWLDALRQSRIPIGLLNGSQDPVSGKHLVARYRELVDRDDYIDEADELGHYPQVEDPARFVTSHRTFLDRINSPDSS